MTIICNGQTRDITAGMTISTFLAELDLRGPIAVEVNRELAPREQHPTWQLHEGDELEIVTLVGGG